MFSGSQKIGTAQVAREGLYYRIHCNCSLSGDVLYKIILHGEQTQEDLGICVPMDGAFGIRTRIPIKRIGGELRFIAVPRHRELTDHFIPVENGSPFPYIDRLENAFLDIRNGQTGIALAEGVMD